MRSAAMLQAARIAWYRRQWSCGRVQGTPRLVGAGAVVSRDVAPEAIVSGNPAREFAR
jgi:hypothetical protein